MNLPLPWWDGNFGDSYAENTNCESNCGKLENDTVSEDSDSNIRPPKYKNKNIIESDSDEELEEEWNEHDITPKQQNYLNIPVVTQTNLYHSQMKGLHKTSAKTVPWTEVTTNEIKKFLGLLILMGQTRKSHWRDYWSTDPLVEAPIFRATIFRMRFEQILTFFNLNDNTQHTSSKDRLCKVRPLLNYIIPKFQSLYYTQAGVGSRRSNGTIQRMHQL
ncbi:piggyBac transposable element-derived protein 4-like [Vespa crabro]|uniref:piggyBac transposable element-derived protein 4-like n=1 Tax=Vespa crabro TaxID=7445 RepID=UPI001F02E778|nr:piggyBac transposable element-derived protein 4-like [Vespa crabro]